MNANTSAFGAPTATKLRLLLVSLPIQVLITPFSANLQRHSAFGQTFNRPHSVQDPQLIQLSVHAPKPLLRYSNGCVDFNVQCSYYYLSLWSTFEHLLLH
jgi:hypothetical protein